MISETNLYELHHRARLAIKPGITGMWQVSGRSDITDFEEVVRLDKEYITNWNIGLDIKILLKDIILTVSHLGNIIMDYFGDGSGISPVTGKSFGVNIEYYFEKEPLGNAGALFKIKDKLTEDFLLLNADAMFDVDFNRFVEFHKSHGGLVTLFTHPNSHPYDSGLIIANENGIVQKWLAKEDERPLYYKNRVREKFIFVFI